MKKYFYLLLAIVLFTPMIVLGDSAGPSILGYDAVVINPDGAKNQYESETKVVPYNLKVKVIDEYGDNAVIEFCSSDNNCYNAEVSLKDIKPLKDEVIPTDKDVKDEDNLIKIYNKNIMIYNKNGAKLSKGPAEIYEEYSQIIPHMTIIKAQYIISSWGDGSSRYYPWFYVNDGKYKGWVRDIDVAYTTPEQMLFESIKILDEKGNAIQSVPKGTVLKNLYEFHWDSKTIGHYYLEYNGKKGFVKSVHTGYLMKGTVLAKKDTKLYDINNKELATIKSGDAADVLYADDAGNSPAAFIAVYVDDSHSYYYVQYNGKKGFVNGKDVLGIGEYELSKKTLEIKKDTTLYNFDEWGFFNDKKIGTIKKGEVVNSYRIYDNGELKYYLIVNNGKIGYVNVSDAVVTNKKVTDNKVSDNNITDNNSTNVNDNKTNNDNQDVNNNTDNNDTTDVNNNVDNQNNENNNNINETKPSVQKKSNDTLIFAILGAIIVSLVAVIIVLLVNKNKGVKNVVSTDVKKENTNVETSMEHEPIKLNNEKDTEKKD